MFSTFWAKKKDYYGLFQWLPLDQHLEDTRQIAGLLWEHWLSDGQKFLVLDLFHNKDEDKAKGLVQFIASIHDIGKASPAFQVKKGFVNTADLDSLLLEKLEYSGYTGISRTQLASISSSPHALAGQYILSILGIREDIASIIGAHHGKPISSKEVLSQQKSYGSNYHQFDDADLPVSTKWIESQKSILDWALETNGFQSIEELPEIPQTVQVLLSGLLIMADWIASNERYFPLLSIETDRVENSEYRMQQGWLQWKKTDNWAPRSSGEVRENFESRFKFYPNSIQSTLIELIANTKSPGITILEAPMGIGKTEAALFVSELLAEKTGRSGVFFGLPTQATSNGMFPRVYNWLSKQKNIDESILSIQLAHSKAALNKSFYELAHSINVDEDHDATVIVNEWFSGRKTSALDNFVVGTVDHFLLLALKQKHLALRHLGFSKKVVVIDEVHAYDAYMNQYLQQALRWMGAYQVPVIILSATLPARKREELVSSYLRGRGVGSKDIKGQLDLFDKNSYPLITFTDGEEIKQHTEFANLGRKTISIEKVEPNGLFNLLESLVDHQGVIGIIVNTVKKAQEITLECLNLFGEEIELIHSNFISTQRIQKEDKLLEMIGKDASRPRKKIIIGTQVLEQSLDIDFDVLISDLAPIDLLIQRIGRLHRHDIERHNAYINPVCYVLGTSDDFDFDEGSMAVYGGYLLARTQMILADEIEIPQSISSLIQQVYSEEPIVIPDNLKEKYEKMKQEHILKLERSERKARAYRIDNPVLVKRRGKENSMIGWLSNSTPLESEEQVFAQVRDIKETIEVIALKKWGTGYTVFGEDEDYSEKIHELNCAKKLAQQTLRLPMLLSASYNIESTIRELEALHSIHFKRWHEQPWLKGALGIIFDENNEALLNGFLLKYDEKLGLISERM